MSVEHLDDLRAATRHARERYQLYEAKAYGPRPTSPARLRELQRCYEQADARLRAAEAEAQRTGAAGDASVSGSLRGRSLRTSLNTDAHQRRYFCIASRKRACAASASARPDLVRSRSVSACSDALASRRNRQLSLLCQLRLTAAGAARHSATFRATSCPARRLAVSSARSSICCACRAARVA